MNAEMSIQELINALDNLDWGICIFDEKARFLWVNSYVVKTSCRTRAFYYGKSVYDLASQGILNAGIVLEAYKKKSSVTRVQRSISDSGKSIDYLVTAKVIFDGDGNIKYGIADRIKISELEEKLQLTQNELIPRIQVRQNDSFDNNEIIFQSEKMRQIVFQAEQVANVNSSVLLTGASGTGKDVIARYIYRKSKMYGKNIVEINCASMPESLLESELFGYAKGAFTGALSTGKPGLIETANDGVLFLDEINSMPLGLQAKLLRVLESREITRIGAVKPIKVNFRLISATNRSLKRCVQDGQFREDLYYRVNVIPIDIPPLAERKEDIRPLADYFLKKYCTMYDLEKRFSPSVYDIFERHPWHGNVRELRNVVERLVVMSTTSTVEIKEVPKSILDEDNISGKFSAKEHSERQQILDALEVNHGHRANTAAYLKISRRTLQYKIKKYGIAD